MILAVKKQKIGCDFHSQSHVFIKIFSHHDQNFVIMNSLIAFVVIISLVVIAHGLLGGSFLGGYWGGDYCLGK
jgi:hypothetical protein